MSLRPRANEIPELIRRLGSRNRVRVDSAKARLSVIGGRAVEALIESLDGDNNRVRSHAMQLLALIHDPRGREPLRAMLLDRSPSMRETAARALARFPARDTAAALEQVVRNDGRCSVRIAALQSLIALYAAGEETALAAVFAVLFDEHEDPALRLAAFAVLPRLSSAERKRVVRRLRADPVPEIAARAEGAGTPPPDDDGGATIEDLLYDLGSDEYATWNEAVRMLERAGSDAVEPLIDEMQRRGDDPEYCTRAGMVLRGLGPRRGRAVGDALERVREPLPLQVLVEVVGAFGVRAMIYRLKDLIDALAERNGDADAAGAREMFQRVRAKAHLELARIGSRVAIEDLRTALEDPHRRIELEVLAAVELIGKRDELRVLLHAHRKEDAFMQDRIAEVVKTVMRRERIRRNSVVLRSLGERDLATLETVLGKPVTRRKSDKERA